MNPIDDTFDLTSAAVNGLRRLAAAAALAEATHHPLWNLAVSLGELIRAGCDETDVRQLLVRGLAEHRREIKSCNACRAFRPVVGLQFTRSSCFVITDVGRCWQMLSRSEGVDLPQKPRRDVPFWDETARELYWRGELILRFRHPAANQEAILRVFQVSAWPSRIRNPLHRPDEKECNARLRDAVRTLNKNLEKSGLTFQCVGGGLMLMWYGDAARYHDASTTLP